MKIAILITSRNRPRLLSAAITALHEMESGEHEVCYCVGIDADDVQTKETVLSMQNSDLDICYKISGENDLTIGRIWNNLTDIMTGAEIYSCMIDDAFPISPHWDKYMVDMAKQYDAFTWHEVSAPNNIGYPTCTKTWLDRVGYISEEHYPYWFFDTAFCELVWLITNKPVPVSHHLALYSKQEATQNLRDLAFWWKFFRATRSVRVVEAHRIAGNGMSLDEFTQSRLKWIALGEARDAEFIGTDRIAKIEAMKGVLGEPSSKYLIAKINAEKYLVEHGLTLS